MFYNIIYYTYRKRGGVSLENYSLITEKVIKEIEASGKKPTLLIHACCAPCSSYVLEYLAEYFEITLYFYNPNISPESEHDFRFSELVRYVRERGYQITVQNASYEPDRFFEAARGLEKEPEGGKRCAECYRLRLSESGRYAKEHGFDFFTTTLSISPHKNAGWLNEIGGEISDELGIEYLYSDFKKKNGYKRSIELSREYGLYRQDYCGCIYSKTAKENAK